MPFDPANAVPVDAQSSNAAPKTFDPKNAVEDNSDPSWRLGPVASSIVRPIAKGLASIPLGLDPEPKNIHAAGGKTIPNPRFMDEFEQFLDKYTTKPKSTGGKIVEEVGSVVAGGLVPGGPEARLAEKGGAALEAGAEQLSAKGAALREAARYNLKVAPEDMENPNLIGRMAATVGGRAIDRAVSRHNAERFDELGANFIGKPPGTPLIDETFEEVRDTAGKAYDELRKLPTVDGKTITEEVRAIGSNIAQIYEDMPEAVDPSIMHELNRIKGALSHDSFSPNTLIASIKFWRADATRSFASKDPKDWYRATFERQAADVAEICLERAAEASGHPNLISDVKNARKLIARSYTLQDATNTATGHVNAEMLARLSKDRPLDGEAEIIANFAKAHRHSALPIDRIGSVESMSKLRFFVAAGAFLSGHPGYAGAVAAEAIASGIGASRLTQAAGGAGRAAAEGTRGFNRAGAAMAAGSQLEQAETQ